MGEPISTRKFHTNKTWKETTQDIAHVFGLWGIDRGEWGMVQPPTGQRWAEVWYYLPYDPSRKSIACLSQDDAPTNLRQCLMTLTELQRAAIRGVSIKSGREEMLALSAPAWAPDGTPLGDAAQVNPPGPAGRPQPERRRSAFRGLNEACQVLGITPDTDEQDAADMRRIKLSRFHPDNRNGTANEDAYKRVSDAWAFIKERKGWGDTEP